MIARTRTTTRLAALLVALGLALLGCGSDAEPATEPDTTEPRGADDTAPNGPPPPALSGQPYTTPASPSQVLDLWLPETTSTDEAVPLVVFIHGGGWVEGDRSQAASKVPTLLDRGYAVASLDYRLADEAVFPAAVQDAKAAVRWLRAHASEHGIDPDAIAVWGESAGGHLAAMVGVTGDQATIFDDPSLGEPDTSSAVQAVVDWFGPVDLLQMQQQELDHGVCDDPYDHDADDSYESKWLGESLQQDVDVAELADPIRWLPTAGALPPFSIAHGDRDCTVDIGQSLLLVTALELDGQHPQVITLSGAGHMDRRFDAEVLSPTIDWLDQVLGR